MKKILLTFFFTAITFTIGITSAQAQTFGSDCELVMTAQPNEFTFHMELLNKSSGERDALCTVETYRIENQEDSTAILTNVTEYSMDVSVSDGDRFTVYVEKNGEAVSLYLESPILAPEDTTESICMNTVVDLDGNFSIELLGIDGERSADCRFTEYTYEVLSGEAELIGMNEYTLFFDGTKIGTVRVTTTSPSYYWAEFEIGSSYSGEDVPPAGYEDEVITSFVDFENPFPDTDISSLEGKAAAELYRRAVIGGYPDGEFKGEKEVNRAEAAKFLLYARYGTVDDIENNGKFPDVLDGEWYTKFVVYAAEQGIINGYPDGLFRPANTVNTAEFLKMLSLTFGLEENLSYSYTDVDSEDWFSPYAGTAEKYELFPERVSSLNPSQDLTRSEVAIAIYQYLQNR